MDRNLQPPTPKVSPISVVVPVSKGGTGATNAVAAAANLGAINSAALGAANGLVQADATGKVAASSFPTVAAVGATLQGSKQLSVGQVAIFQITNYDSLTNYLVSVDIGTISVNGDTLTYTAPNATGNANISINGKLFPVTIGAIRPKQPVVTAVSSASGSLAKITLSGSAFAMTSGTDTQRSADWEVYSDVGLTNLVLSSLDDSVNKTSYVANNVALNATFYIRARYRSNSSGEYSSWSNTVTHTTQSIYFPSTEEAVLVLADGAASDNFGASVSISDDGMRVVSATRDKTVSGLTGAGAVYVFTRSGTTWVQEAKITAPTPTASAGFGSDVAISADGIRIVVGEYLKAGPGGSNQGAAYIFTRSGTVWSFEATMTCGDNVVNTFFGIGVSINGDGSRIVVGGSLQSSSKGSAYVFSRSGTTWTQEAKLAASDVVAGDNFGNRVVITADGTRILVSAHGKPGPSGQTAVGAAYVFSRSGTTWTQEAKLLPSVVIATSFFGLTIDITNDALRCVVGAVRFDVDVGAAFVFTRSGTTWTEEAKLGPGVATAVSFGRGIAIDDSGTKLSIGANGFTNTVNPQGAVFNFTRTGTTWTLNKTFYSSNPVVNEGFGAAIAMTPDASRSVVGAPSKTINGNGSQGNITIEF